MSFYNRVIEYFAERALGLERDGALREQAALALRASYAALKSQSRVLKLTAAQRSIYGVTRLAGTLASMRDVLEIFLASNPSPSTILDLGSGPGTALLAAFERFGAAAHYVGIEKDPGFIAMAKEAIAHLLPEAKTQFDLRQGQLPDLILDDKFDLSMLSYVLSETPATLLEPMIDFALNHSKGHLIITDAGTPLVYRQLMAARALIIARGWSILAPCPHQLPCPMKGNDFCHFPARFTRHQEARRLKQGSAQAEDEKYCYLIAQAPGLFSSPLAQKRMVKKPLLRHGHCIVDLCAASGQLERHIVSKKHPETWRQLKKSSWGDDATFISTSESS